MGIVDGLGVGMTVGKTVGIGEGTSVGSLASYEKKNCTEDHCRPPEP